MALSNLYAVVSIGQAMIFCNVSIYSYSYNYYVWVLRNTCVKVEINNEATFWPNQVVFVERWW